MRILIGPFKAYSGLLYELYLGPMMVNIRTLGTCKLNIHELAQKYQIQSNLAKNKIGNGLPGEYLQKAWDTDWTCCGTAAGEQGPVQVERRLTKLVIGPFAECGEDLHELLNAMTKRARPRTNAQCPRCQVKCSRSKNLPAVTTGG